MKSWRVSLRLPTGHCTSTVLQSPSMQELYRLVAGLFPGAEIGSVTEI